MMRFLLPAAYNLMDYQMIRFLLCPQHITSSKTRLLTFNCKTFIFILLFHYTTSDCFILFQKPLQKTHDCFFSSIPLLHHLCSCSSSSSTASNCTTVHTLLLLFLNPRKTHEKPTKFGLSSCSSSRYNFLKLSSQTHCCSSFINCVLGLSFYYTYLFFIV